MDTDGNDGGGAATEEEDAVTKLAAQVERVFVHMGLSRFSSRIALQYLVSRLNAPGGLDRMRRAVDFMVDGLNRAPRRPLVPPAAAAAAAAGDGGEGVVDWQAGCPNLVRGLRAQPVWDTAEFPWIAALEAACPAIVAELEALKGKNAFQPYRAPSHAAAAPTAEGGADGRPLMAEDALGALATDRGHWNVCYLQLHGMDFEGNLAKCPQTAAALSAIPRSYRHAFFSALAPDTHVYKHHGPTNKKLRCHLPLRVPAAAVAAGGEGSSVDAADAGAAPPRTAPSPTCWLRVADQVLTLREGQAVVFDDSFEHEACNEHPDLPRVVLVVDFWHPSFTDEEVKFFEFIDKMQIAAAKKIGISTEELGSDGDTFLSVIERARQAADTVDESLVWATSNGR
jgi:aspartate beta-hydroxylase